MKSGFALTMGIFISFSAIVFFKQEERVLAFISGKQFTPPADEKNNTVKKVKSPLTTQKKKAAAQNKNASVAKKTDWASALAVPSITAIKTVDKTVGAVSGDVLTYTVNITNNSGTNVNDLTFTDNIDINTTLVPGSVITSPVAENDAYTALGNVGINVPDANGILANDDLGTNPAAVFGAVTNAATTQGGIISINVNGGISYTPAAGFSGTDSYTYTLSNAAGSSSGTISITVSGMIWFINNNSVAVDADGRLNTPFKTVAAFQAVNDGVGLHPAANQNIFVYESATAYDGNITLLNGQTLIGQDASASLATIAGYTSYTYSTPLLPAMDNVNAVITNLTATTAVNVVTLNGGSGGTYTIRGLTIGNKTTGSGISGSSFGSVTIAETSIAGTGRALNLTTGMIAATFGSVSSSSGVNAVSLTGVSGTAILGTGTMAGSTGPTFYVNGGTVTTTYNGGITQVNNAPLVSVESSHTGTLTFQTGTLSASAGTGLQFSAANGSYNFNGVTSLNGGDAGVDIVATSLGTFVFSANTSITNPSGNAFQIGSAGVSSGGTGNVTYNGSISKTSAGRAVEIQNKTGGVVAFTGNIAATTGSTGINLLTNGGATINFSGGLNLNTGASIAFNATGGGTVSATQNNSTIINTIVTTTEIGLNVANTTIGSSGLTFRSVNVNGATKGISLNTTGAGGLTITGTGTGGTGGTIQNISARGIEIISAQNISLTNINLTNANTTNGSAPCDDNGNGGCNAALYISTATTVTLTGLNITTTAQQGMNFNNITTLTVSNCLVQGNGNETQESALKARDIKGTSTITNSTFKNSAHRIAHIINTSSTAHLTVDGCTFINEASNLSPVKQDCFEMETQSTATVTIIIKNSIFKRAGTKGIQIAAKGASNATVAITNCTVDRDAQLMAGIEVIADGATAIMNANVDGNPVIQSDREVGLNVYSGITGTMQATARNNAAITGGNNPNLNSFANLRAAAAEQSNSKVLFTNNSVSGTDLVGIETGSYDGTNTGTINATIDGNTVVTNNLAGNLTVDAVRVFSTATVGAANVNCTNVKNNNITRTNGTATTPSIFTAETGTATSNVSLQSNSGAAVAGIAALWNGNNNLQASPPAPVLELKTPGSTIIYGGVTCLVPTNLVVATSIFAIAGDPDVDSKIVLPNELEAIDLTTPGAADNFSDEEPAGQVANAQSSAFSATAAVVQTTSTNVTVTDIDLPPSKTITIKFQVTVNNPLPIATCAISNQGSVSGTSITTLLTDNDADQNNGINPTVTSVLDEIDPVVNVCPSTVTVETGVGNTNCTQTATWTEPTATDNCSGALTYFSRSHVPGDVFQIGTTTVTYIFKDAAGNDATCTFDVVVQDNTVPNVSGCPTAVTVQTGVGNTTCTQTATWTEPTATDNCGGALTFFSRSHAPGATFNKGTTTVTYIFKDAAGNQGSCSFDVVVQDNTLPVVSGCPSTINVQTGAGNTTCTQTATWTEPTAADACDGSLAYFSRSHAPGSSFNKGTTTVTYIFKDAAGNQSSCSFDVVVTDNTAPVLSCPANQTVIESPAGAGSAIVNYPAATATDNCPGIGTIMYSQASGTSFPVGTTTVNVSVTDAAGIQSNCSFTVTVTPACQITPPANIMVNNAAGQCGTNVTYSPATTTGNCGALNYSHVSGSFFTVGSTTVTVSSPSTGVSNSFTVTVLDAELPQITTCPGNQTVNTAANQCVSSPVSFTAAATDNCTGGLTVKYFIGMTQITSPHVFNKGTTMVTVKAKDAAGNETTCSFNVTVNDIQNPTITPPADVTVNTGAGATACNKVVTVAQIGTATFSDNCPGATVQINGVPAGNMFPVGTTVLTHIVTDASGNVASATQNITVTDNTLPVLNCPANVTVNTGAGRSTCNQVATWTAPTPTDNCGIHSLTSTHNSGATFPVGTTTVQYTALDVNGNQSQCSFTVTVVDNTAPAITGCPANITVQTGAGNTNCMQTATWTAPTATDNCEGPITPYSVSHQPGSSFPKGATTVNYKFKDSKGNESICNFTVTVVDNTRPVIAGCPTSQAVTVSQGGCQATATWTEPTATDNCAGTITRIRSHAPGAAFPQGTTPVTYTFTDAAGNATTCTFNITVNGTLAATIPNAFAYTPGTIANTIYSGWTPASKITYTASVSGGQPPYTYKWTTSAALSIQGSSTQPSVTVTSTTAGTHTLTLKVTDAYGCQKTATRTVTVVDVRCGNRMDKVLLCKVQPAGTICINANDVAAQLANGNATLGACPASSAITKSNAKEVTELFVQSLNIKALPNPTSYHFNLLITSSNKTERVSMRVTNILGQVIEVRNAVPVEQVFRIGDKFKSGVYLVEVIQGDLKQQIKLVKL